MHISNVQLWLEVFAYWFHVNVVTLRDLRIDYEKKGAAKGDIYSGYWFHSNIISMYLTVQYVFPTILVELYLTAPLKVSNLAILRMPGYEAGVEGFW